MKTWQHSVMEIKSRHKRTWNRKSTRHISMISQHDWTTEAGDHHVSLRNQKIKFKIIKPKGNTLCIFIGNILINRAPHA